MAEHRNLTGASLHETKGASSASANTVHTAVGDGTTTWAKLTSSNLDTTSVFNTNKYKQVVQFEDVSTADFILIPVTNTSTLTRVTTMLHTAITGADAILTVTNSNGPATVGNITITQSGSAEGDTDTLSPGSNSSFAAGTYLKIATDGASSTASKLTILLDWTQTG